MEMDTSSRDNKKYLEVGVYVACEKGVSFKNAHTFGQYLMTSSCDVTKHLVRFCQICYFFTPNSVQMVAAMILKVPIFINFVIIRNSIPIPVKNIQFHLFSVTSSRNARLENENLKSKKVLFFEKYRHMTLVKKKEVTMEDCLHFMY